MPRIFVGHIPTADTIFIDGPDPVITMLREADTRLAAEKAAEARALAAKAADIERAKATRAARVTKRFRQAVKLFARTR